MLFSCNVQNRNMLNTKLFSKFGFISDCKRDLTEKPYRHRICSLLIHSAYIYFFSSYHRQTQKWSLKTLPKKSIGLTFAHPATRSSRRHALYNRRGKNSWLLWLGELLLQTHQKLQGAGKKDAYWEPSQLQPQVSTGLFFYPTRVHISASYLYLKYGWLIKVC